MKFSNLILINLVMLFQFDGLQQVESTKCMPQQVMISSCRKYYNTTIGYENRAAIFLVNKEFDSFRELIQSKCSMNIELLVCTAHLPVCYQKQVVKPCKSFCLEVKQQCQAFYALLNKKWPSQLNCDRFPEDIEEGETCFQKLPNLNKIRHHNKFNCKNLKNSQNYIKIDSSNTCALKCKKDGIFTVEEKRFAEIAMSATSILTFVSTTFSCLVFLFVKPVKYPHQTLIFIAFCYFIYSVSILLRVFLGRYLISCDIDQQSNQPILIQHGLDNTSCALTFLLGFFFSTAAYIWWTVTMASWLVFNKWHLSQAKMEEYSGLMHLVVWLTTSMLTIAVLILRRVDADELLGICSIGGQSPEMLLKFSIIPKSLFLFVGVACFFGGLFLSSRSNNLGGNTSKNSQIKSLIPYSRCYIITMLVIISCELYEYFQYNQWLIGASKPIFAIFLMKISFNQAIGYFCLIWIVHLNCTCSIPKFLLPWKHQNIPKPTDLLYPEPPLNDINVISE